MFDDIPTHMDYKGQMLAEKYFQYIIVSFGIAGFLVGYFTEQLSHAMIVLFLGCFIASLVTVPPWPMYRCNPIKWLKPIEAKVDEAVVDTAVSKKKTSKSKKR